MSPVIFLLSFLNSKLILESDFQEIQVEKDPRLSAREVDHHFCMTNADDYRSKCQEVH